MIEAGRAGGLAQAIRGLAALVAVFVLTVSAVSAQDPYVVERVPVDVTATNAAEARERALDEAYGKAFDILIERLGSTRPPGVKPADLSLSIGIDNERVTPVRYSAQVTVHFDPMRVDAALGRSADPVYAGSAGAPGGFGGPMPPPTPMPVGTTVLVLPIYEWSGARTLWETSNPWYQAWNRANARILTGQAAVPQGGATDQSALTVDQALGGDRAALLRLAEGSYGAENVVVILGTYEVDYAVGEPAFHVVAAGYGPQLGGRRLDLRVPGDPNSFVDELADKAVAATVAKIEETWQPGMPVAEAPGGAKPFRPSGPERDIVVTTALGGPADLARVRGRIGGLPMVTRDQLVSLSRGEAVLRVHYAGDTDLLRTAMIDAGFSVTAEADGWLVRPSGEAGSRPLDQSPRQLPRR